MHKKQLTLLFLVLSLSLSAEIKLCSIKDQSIHKNNQDLLANIIENELALQKGDAQEQAKFLRSKITNFASALLEKGFSQKAYAVPDFDQETIVSFNTFVLWEGEKNKDNIPITFFVYVWPSKELALKSNSSCLNTKYASNIHKHPIPCAFAVLDGVLTQNNYESVGEKSIRFTGKDFFSKGEGAIDDLEAPFIHKLYNSGHTTMCVSLHAYGLASEEKVMNCFYETRRACSYEDHRIILE